MNTPQVRYTTAADGAKIAYYERGTGPVVLFELSVYVSNLATEIAFKGGPTVLDAIADSARLVRFDHRGGGMSQRGVEDYSLGAYVSDLAAVTAAAGAEPAVLFAWQCAGQQAIAFCGQPSRPVQRLILWDPTAPKPSDDPGWRRVNAIMPLVDVDWETFSEASVYREADWQNTKLAANYLRSACEPEDFRRSHDARYGTDVTCLVSLVSCPTLVVSTRAETWPAAQFYAREIPNAQLLRLDEEKNYHPLAAPTEEVWEIIASFADLPTRRTNGSDAGHSHTNGHSDGNGNGNGALGANGVLTLRERDVLKLVARGYTNKQIADELVLSAATVKTHVEHVIAKLAAADRTQAAVVAAERGWLHNPS